MPRRGSIEGKDKTLFQTNCIFCERYGQIEVKKQNVWISEGLTNFILEMWKWSFSVEAEARKIHRFRCHLGGKNGERKEIGPAILRRRTNGGEHKH